MKILTGSFKGRRIELMADENLRPTSDLVRKAVFDALQGAFEGKRVLDLFSGTGAFGFEALSSGAKEVVWVESEVAQVENIEKTLSDLELEDRGRVFRSDVFKAIESLGRHGESFDFIFLDPPYHLGLGTKTVKALSSSSLLGAGAIVVLETHKTEDPPENTGKLKTLKIKKHGDTKITFYGCHPRNL